MIVQSYTQSESTVNLKIWRFPQFVSHNMPFLRRFISQGQQSVRMSKQTSLETTICFDIARTAKLFMRGGCGVSGTIRKIVSVPSGLRHQAVFMVQPAQHAPFTTR
jgi:hypothetical protein